MTKKLCLAVLVLLASSAIAAAQAQPAQQSAQDFTIAKVMDHGLSNTEKEFVDAADAMLENKYNFAPTNGEFKGVRTFAQQVKHVAAVNYLVFATILGEKPPVDTGEENGPASIKSKAEITKFLRDSFAYGHRALATLTPENSVAPIDSPFGKDKVTRLGMATLIIGHCFDHYGQMVVYLRMNGIVPPASRK
jgi:uncharacterized damage-inducible protein DinB